MYLIKNNSFHELRNARIAFKTAITVTHRLGSIKNATKIIVLKAGEVIEQGDHLTLLENKGEYYSLLQIQKSMYDF